MNIDVRGSLGPFQQKVPFEKWFLHCNNATVLVDFDDIFLIKETISQNGEYDCF